MGEDRVLDRNALCDVIRAVAQAEPGVRLAYLFGSQARGRAHALSDVDVAVLLAPEVSPLERGQTRLRLAAGLIRRLRRDAVDVVVLNDAPLLLRYQVLAEGQLCFATSDEERARFAADTLVRYLDNRYLFDLLDEAMFRRLREGRFGHQQVRATSTLCKTRGLSQQDPDSSRGD